MADPQRGVGPVQVAMERPLHSQALQLLAGYAPPPGASGVIYLSTPITTGPMLLEWLKGRLEAGAAGPDASEVDLVRQEVIDENLRQFVPLRAAVTKANPRAHVIDPTTLDVAGWSQWEYHRFWVEVISRFVDRVVFADGWNLSTGCTIEYAAALQLGVEMTAASGARLDPDGAAVLLRAGAATLEAAGRDPGVAIDAAQRSESLARHPLKDSRLAELARDRNVASFVSFTPGEPRIRFQVSPDSPPSRSVGVRAAVNHLLHASHEGSVNVRSFRPSSDKGNPFYYGLRTVDDVIERVTALAADGYHCIVNETIDIHDGGVSGVTLGGIAEFSPDDTPRAVEKPDSARLPVGLAQRMLRHVYGEHVVIPAEPTKRIEFSVHPARVGSRREPVLVWEVESVQPTPLDATISWPNRFSQLVGDKTFGLLVAEALDLMVPSSTVVARRIAPFRFGRSTGTGEWWMRTAPALQTPGQFSTTRGWADPFRILAEEDTNAAIAAVIAQEGVSATYSGATLPAPGGGHTVEGVRGFGDNFMMGMESAVELPLETRDMVLALLGDIEDRLGSSVRIEWAVDGQNVWVLQLHKVVNEFEGGTFSSGHANSWLPFDPLLGLEVLAELIEQARESGSGIEVTRPIGLTSHVGDLLRKAQVPGRLAKSKVIDSGGE